MSVAYIETVQKSLSENFKDAQTARTALHRNLVKHERSLRNEVWRAHQRKIRATGGYDHSADLQTFTSQLTIMGRRVRPNSAKGTGHHRGRGRAQTARPQTSGTQAEQEGEDGDLIIQEGDDNDDDDDESWQSYVPPDERRQTVAVTRKEGPTAPIDSIWFSNRERNVSIQDIVRAQRRDEASKRISTKTKLEQKKWRERENMLYSEQIIARPHSHLDVRGMIRTNYSKKSVMHRVKKYVSQDKGGFHPSIPRAEDPHDDEFSGYRSRRKKPTYKTNNF